MGSERAIFRRGPRVSLGILTKEDAPLFLRMMNDPEVNQFLGRYLPIQEQEEEKWLEGLAERQPQNISFGIVLNDGDMLVGSIGLHEINWKDRRAVTGTAIGDKRFWSQGLGTEAKMLLLDYAFHSLNLRKITSRVFEFNQRSQRYSEKCGYKFEARLKEEVFVNGRYWDLILLAVFYEDWLPLWREFQENAGK